MGGWKVNWRCPAIKIKNSEANLKWRSAALQKYVLENGTLVSWILGPTLLAPNSMTWPPSRTTMLLWLCHYHSSCHNMSRQPFLRLMPYPTHPFMRGIPRAILFHVSCSWGGLRKPFLFICLYVCSWRGSPGPFLFMFPAPEDGHHLDTFFIFPPGYVSLMFPTLRRVVGTAPLEGIFHITPHCCWAAGNWTFPWPCFSSFCSPLFSGKKKRASCLVTFFHLWVLPCSGLRNQAWSPAYWVLHHHFLTQTSMQTSFMEEKQAWQACWQH